MDFSEDQIRRYSRNILLKDIGVDGQIKILNSKVLVIGAGGLGSPVLFYLAAAGVGTLGIVDFDKVDMSNLQRQIIHFTKDIGKSKVLSSKEKINELNPDVKINIYESKINASNARKIIKEYDFIIDGTDNFESKFLINDACYFEKKPFSHGGILGFEGQAITIIPGETTCYRCIFENLPQGNSIPTCSNAGVLGSVAGILGSIQATEALKFITGAGDLLLNHILTYDAKTFEFRKIKINKNKNCKICGTNPSIFELSDYEQDSCRLK
jgi:molybdopterin-synthase adenylyltransferase